MDKFILIGCDLHDKSILLMAGVGGQQPQKRSFQNTVDGRKAMISWLKACSAKAGPSRIVLAYEASGLGFGLHDELTDAGVTCHVLAPTKIERSAQHRKTKTDEKDALHLLEILRGHYLAGNRLPSIWIPDKQTRDDRECVRARLDAQDKLGVIKTQIKTLLKRNGLVRPAESGKGWTKAYIAWLRALAECDAPLTFGARTSLDSLLRQMDCMEEEVQELDRAIAHMSGAERYQSSVAALVALAGVGLLSAMVFLTEMGDLKRFNNRRQIGAFLGVVPSCNESGETTDRKGRITLQGPARVRFVLCQASWNRVRSDPVEKAVYQRIVEKNKKRKKKALVAAMRRLAIRMWHTARDAASQSA